MPLCDEPGGPGRARYNLTSPVDLDGCWLLSVALKRKLCMNIAMDWMNEYMDARVQ